MRRNLKTAAKLQALKDIKKAFYDPKLNFSDDHIYINTDLITTEKQFFNNPLNF